MDTIFTNSISTLVGVLLGGAITIFANYLLEKTKQNAKYSDKLFELRFDFYQKYMRVLNQGYTTLANSADPDLAKRYPIAYKDKNALLEWHKSSVTDLDNSLILIDRTVFKLFQALNSLVIRHIEEIEKSPTPELKDKLTVQIGQRDCNKILESTTAVANAISEHLNKLYSLRISKLELLKE